MKKIHSYYIQNIGVDNGQYIQVSAHGTDWEGIVLGAGQNAAEAYRDCVDQLASNYDVSIIPKRPTGINKKDRLRREHRGNDDLNYYVAIAYSSITETEPQP